MTQVFVLVLKNATEKQIRAGNQKVCPVHYNLVQYMMKWPTESGVMWHIFSRSLMLNTNKSKCSRSCRKRCFHYRAGDVVLTQEDLIHSQFRLVIIDVLNCNVDSNKWLQTYKGETKKSTWLATVMHVCCSGWVCNLVYCSPDSSRSVLLTGKVFKREAWDFSVSCLQGFFRANACYKIKTCSLTFMTWRNLFLMHMSHSI